MRNARMKRVAEPPGPDQPLENDLIDVDLSDGIPSDALERRDLGVFAQLVSGDRDIAGLIAYSMYKQNKVDWLEAFEKKTGRLPNACEALAFNLAETTSRRLSTYRKLAEVTLSSKSQDERGGRSADRVSILRALVLCAAALIVIILAVGHLRFV